MCTAAAAAALRENFPPGQTWSRRARIHRSSGCSSGTWPDFAWKPYSTHFLSSGQVRVVSHFTLRASRCFLFLFKLLRRSESPQTSAPDRFILLFDYSSCSLVSPCGCLREDEGFPEGIRAAVGHPRVAKGHRVTAWAVGRMQPHCERTGKCFKFLQERITDNVFHLFQLFFQISNI